ncbi:MAG: gamma carbonic anhydrase family protein [Bacteroidota bacterium]
MSIIRTIRGFTPSIGEKCFLAETATILGDVIIGKECSIWYNAVLRGDVNPIRIGDKVNVQDNAVLHCLFERSIVEIGNNVSIGHHATVHGAKIDNNVLIGIGAIILDNVVIGENSIIAAGAVVLSNTIVEPGSIYAGVPAKKIGESGSDALEKIRGTAERYITYASWYKNE